MRKMIGNDQVEMIDWDTPGKAMRLNIILQGHWVSKFVVGWCATGNIIQTRI